MTKKKVHEEVAQKLLRYVLQHNGSVKSFQRNLTRERNHQERLAKHPSLSVSERRRAERDAAYMRVAIAFLKTVSP